AEVAFLRSQDSQETFDFSVICDERFLDQTVFDKLESTLRQDGLQLTPSQILVLNKYIKD
ncbi:hypothetical protein, partial [Enterococcus faecium]